MKNISFLLLFTFSINSQALQCGDLLVHYEHKNAEVVNFYTQVNLMVPQSSSLITLAINSLWVSKSDLRVLFKDSLSPIQLDSIVNTANSVHSRVRDSSDEFEDDDLSSPIMMNYVVTADDVIRLYNEFVQMTAESVEKSTERFLSGRDTSAPEQRGLVGSFFFGERQNLFHDFNPDSERVISYFRTIRETFMSHQMKLLLKEKGWHRIQKDNDRYRERDTEDMEHSIKYFLTKELIRKHPELKRNIINNQRQSVSIAWEFISYFMEVYDY